MASLRKGWGIQVRVVQALMVRELTTRFGRENIGFLWIMVEPMLFAGLVGLLWRVMKGATDFGLDIVVFVISGYIPLVLFRSAVNRSLNCFTANGALLYHRQVKILDLILVRFLIELVGHMMAYLVIALALGALGFFPFPYDMGFLLLGWAYYALFTLAVCLVIAPISEMNEVLEKFIPVTTYLMVPLSGAFFILSALQPNVAKYLLYSPPVHAMEMMRFGIFGPSIAPHYDFIYPLMFCFPCLAVGLFLCRVMRKRLTIE